MLTITPYTPANFLSPVGAWKCANKLEKRGFPTDLRGWRFITLTIDRAQYPDPQEAYNIGKRHLREFMYRLSQYYAINRWCWKLEFHKADMDGRIWPHWHLLLDYKKKMKMENIRKLWGKGRTEIQRVKDQGFRYLFKYVSKNVHDLPTWILNSSHVRFFQTSKGFFDSVGAPKTQKKPSPRQAGLDRASNTQNEVTDLTIGERIEKWSRIYAVKIHFPHGHARYAKINANDSWGLFRLQMCQAKLGEKIPESVLRINSNKIETSCPRLLAFLPTLSPSATLLETSLSAVA